MTSAKQKKKINKYCYLNQSKIHNKGIFALKDIKTGTRIIEYTGELVTKQEGDKRDAQMLQKSKKNQALGSTYIFYIDKKFDLDGNTKTNYAKYINHSCEPNCKYKIKNKRVWIYAKKNIPKDEELTYNYGIEWNPKTYKNYPCKCGSKKCAGYMLEEKSWNKIKKTKKNKTS